MLRLLLFVLLLCLPLQAKERALELTFDGWSAGAVLSMPSDGEGPWPTVILFHGSGPQDMDATIGTSANFRLIAERLNGAGFACLRYHKRGVRGPGQIDFQAFLGATTNQLINDAEATLDYAKQQPEVDSKRLFLYGWSQGAQVAAHTARRHPEIAGLILHGAPTSGWSGILGYQHRKLGLPYLERKADQDQDGALSVAELVALKPGTPVANMGFFYHFNAPDSTFAKPKLNPDLDRDGNNQIEIQKELRPKVQALVEDPASGTSPFIDPANEPTRQIHQILIEVACPVLVLHGEADGWVPLADARRIANHPKATLKTYQGLGHSLSPTEEPALDAAGRMAEAPLADLVMWLRSLAVD